MSSEKERIDKEVEQQLEYLFSEAEAEGSNAGKREEARPDPLRELKAIFLAVDWEINDDIMIAMLKGIDSLKATFKKDRILTLFLQLLETVGKYVKIQKANAHPDAIKLLNSIYTSLEIVSMSEGMTDVERKKILMVEVQRFKALKEKIAQKKAPAKPSVPDTGTPPEVVAPPLEATPDALRHILEEIRKTIRAEFAALKSELKS